MRKNIAALTSGLLLILLVFSAALTGISQTPSPGPWSQNTSPLPAPTGFVNDYAGVIDAATKTQLESKLKAYKESSNPSTEIAVAVVRTTGDRDIFDYSLAVARGWKIGSKDDDNPGALLLIAVDDRKYFTQISKDLEDELPDGTAGSLQRQYLVPEFRKGNYGKGRSDTIDAYISAIQARRSGVPTPTPTPSEPTAIGSMNVFSWFCCLAILLVGGLILYEMFQKKTPRGGGGVGSGGGGGLPWIIPVGTGSSWGSSDSSSSSSWGGSSDWGGSGGGSDWGGFGGGGDFGGGGSGGSW
jgi:uncharacterized protein